MTAVTLGDLLDSASGSLHEATSVRDLHTSTIVAASVRLRRVVTALSRYVAEPRAYPDPAAATYAQVRLFQAAGSLARAARAGAAVPGPGAAHPFTAVAGSGVAPLIAGLDLLATHYTEDRLGFVERRSPWADVLAAPATRTALLAEIAAVADAAGSACNALAVLPAPALPAASRDALRAAAAQLSAILPAPAGEPDYRQLVRAVPDAMTATRSPASEAEPVAVLCDQIAASAARIRVLTWNQPPDRLWPPAPSLGTWRWQASACAITGRISEQILAGLADRAPGLGLAAHRPALEHAAGATAAAWPAWRHTASTARRLTEAVPWDAPGPLQEDLTDLMVRLGRLAYANPMWTPAASQRAPTRTPAELAPLAIDLPMVLDAVHHAADALVHVAAADLALAQAARPGQITPAAPEAVNVTAEDLVDLYAMTSQAAARCAKATGAVAARIGTPSVYVPVPAATNRHHRQGESLARQLGADEAAIHC
jgi:hypothetical protein